MLILTISNLQPIQAVEVRHYYEEVTTCATTDTNSLLIMEISDPSEFDYIDGREYLVIGKAQFSGDSISENVGIFMNLIGGSGGSNKIIEPSAVASCSNSEEFQDYMFFDVFTSNSAPQQQMRTNMGDTGDTIYYDNVSMFVMELSVELTENVHWFYDTGGQDLTLTDFASTDDNASITISGINADDADWLIMGSARLTTGSTGKQYETRLNWNQGTDVPLISQEGEDTTHDAFIQTFVRVINLSSGSSHTFETESQRESGGGGTHTRSNSKIFALNLDKFDRHSFVYDNVVDQLTTGEFNETQETIDITPTVTGDVLVMYMTTTASTGVGDNVEIRLQVEDNSSVLNDEPPDQTTETRDFNEVWDITDFLGWSMMTLENLNTNTHTINIDASETSADASTLDGTLLAFTMEIASTPATDYKIDLLDLFESESTTLGSGISLCQNVDLEVTSTCNSGLEVGHTYRAEVTVRNDGTDASSPTGFEMDATVLNFGLLGNIPVSQLLDSGCSTNTNWTESISSTDAVATSGTTCSIAGSGGTAVFWMVFRILSDAGGGADPTMTFTILGGGDTDTSTTTTFNVNNILQGGMY